jgi:DNA-binding NarL/FixJ family response regulator
LTVASGGPYRRRVPIRIVICDDHPLFRQGLRRLLETVRDFEVVAEVERGDEVGPAVRKHRPEVVVLDVELPGGSGIAAVEQIHRDRPETRVLMLSGFSDPTRVRAALRGGADGYILKNAPPAEIIDAIRRVAGGHAVLAPAVAETVAASLRAEPEEERARRLLATLSERELEVLRLAAAGESNAGIGKRLFISEGTVKNHMTHILRKLEVEDRTQAAILAVKHGVAG